MGGNKWSDGDEEDGEAIERPVPQPGYRYDNQREGGTQGNTEEEHTEGHQLSDQRNPVHWEGEGDTRTGGEMKGIQLYMMVAVAEDIA